MGQGFHVTSLFTILKPHKLTTVTVPEVCIQQFVQVEYHVPYNKIADQIHETPPYPVKFSFLHHISVGPSHQKHSCISLCKKPSLLLDLYQGHKPAEFNSGT